MIDLDEVERCLDVGRPAVLYIKNRRGGETSARVIIRGWQRGGYLLLDLPAEGGLGIGLRAGDNCKLRFLADGDACGLESTLADLGSGSHFSYARINWPHSMTVTRVRKHQRVQISVPCTIRYDGENTANGEIQDLSVGGCRIELDRMIPQGSEISVSFALPGMNTLSSATAQVCAASVFTGGAWMGCKFTEIGDETRYDIEFYVTTASANLRSDQHRDNHVLIIDTDLHNAAPLREALTGTGYEVTVTPNLVDGFFWLRAAPPALVLLHAEPKPFRSLDVLRSLRSIRAFSHLPVVIYAGAAADQNAAAEAGADHFFISSAQVHELVAAVESCLNATPNAANS